MILPSYLRQLGYEQSPTFSRLDTISYVDKGDHLEPVVPWYQLEDVLDYLCCVELARHRLLSLPKGSALGSKDIVPARHDSASLVFFSQATLDNIAVWLNRTYTLGLRGTQVSFYKSRIAHLLADQDLEYVALLTARSVFIQRLNSYRMQWLHRLAGGARLFSDKVPSDPDANVSIQVPIDPAILSLRTDSRHYLERIEEVRGENHGEWLMPVDVFANYIADGTVGLVTGLIEIALARAV